MSLYIIAENIILRICEEKNFGSYPEGRYEHIESVKDFTFPIKIIFSVQANAIIIISAFPLKRGINESIL